MNEYRYQGILQSRRQGYIKTLGYCKYNVNRAPFTEIEFTPCTVTGDRRVGKAGEHAILGAPFLFEPKTSEH